MSSTTTPRLGAHRTPAARLGVQVVHDLVSAIVTGEVAPGDLLPTETELCENFGVSRTVIRESMKRLEEKGMVSVVQGRGTQIAPQSEWNILDRVVLGTMIENDETLGILDELAVVRGQLESSIAAAAASARSDDELRVIQGHLDTMHATAEERDAFAAADVAFHFAVMDVAGDRLASGIARSLSKRAGESSRYYGAPGADAVRLTLEEHQRVYDAIEAGDSDAAAREMRDHIALAWERRRIRD